jgi:hypothetical protein
MLHTVLQQLAIIPPLDDWMSPYCCAVKSRKQQFLVWDSLSAGVSEYGNEDHWIFSNLANPSSRTMAVGFD